MRPTMFALLLGATVLSGCSTVRENTAECQRAPTLRVEERPKPPVSEDEQIWQPGSWEWNGSSYAWRQGAWIKRVQAGGSTLWMDGYWTRENGPNPCYWVPAHWVR